MAIISENLKYDYLQYDYLLRKFEEIWLFAIRVIFLVLTIVGSICNFAGKISFSGVNLASFLLAV